MSIYHTFVGMKKRAFQSDLFLRKIEPSEKDFWAYVIAECLYRLNDKNVKDCDCMIHQEQRKKLKAGLEKVIDIRHEEVHKRINS